MKDKNNNLLELINQCLEGNKKAFEIIYERFKMPVYNLIFRYTYNHAVSEDLLQDTFVKVLTNLHMLKNKETFVNWLYRIAINNSMEYLRQNKKFLKGNVAFENVAFSTFTKDKDKNTKYALEKIIKKLPPKMKTVFLLHDVQGFKHEEISKILGCSPGTSKSQLFKARMKIREFFKKQGF